MKRFLTVLLATVLAISLLLTGCSGGNSSASKTDAKPASTAAAAAATAAAAPAATAAQPSSSGKAISGVNEFPIVKEKVTMSVAIPQHYAVTDYENNKLTKFLEDKSNVKIKFELLPEKEYKDKLNIMLNSGGALPDVILNCGLTNEQQVQYGTQKVFQPLNGLIEKHGYNIKEMLKAIPGSINQITAPDGNIYALPVAGTCYNCMLAQRFWVNTEFLKNLNMKPPTTTDELYNYLKAVKTKDPNKNGKADEIPLTGSIQGWYQYVEGFLMNPFVPDNATELVNQRNRLFLKNDVITAAFVQPEFKEGLLYMNKLLKEGLLDPAAFTQDQAALRTLVENKDAMLVGSLSSGGTHMFTNPTGGRKAFYQALPPIKGPKGIQGTSYEKYRNLTPGKMAITKDCKIPEIAFKWADMQYTEDIHKRSRYGEPKVDWEEPAPGTVAVNGGQAKYKEILKWGAPQASHWAGGNPFWTRFGSDAREVDKNDPFELEKVLFDAAKAYEPYKWDELPPFFFGVEEAKKFTEYKKVINDYVNESVARFVTGDLNIEKNWDAYVKELDAMGLKDYLKMQQTNYDKNWKGK